MRRYDRVFRDTQAVQGSDQASDLYVENVDVGSTFGFGSHGHTLGGISAVAGAGASNGAGAGAVAGTVTTMRSGGGGSLLRESAGSQIRDFVETVDTIVDTIDVTQADADLVKAITTGVLDGIMRLGFTERHSEVLEAITNVTVQPLDLAAVVDEITSAVTGAVSNVHAEPSDIGPLKQMMQELQREIRAVREDLRRDFQSDLAVLQQELLANRKETRSDAEVLLEELRKVPEQLTEVRGSVAAEEEIQLTAAITTGVLDGITRLGLMERHSEVLEAITNVTLQPPDLAAVIDEMTSLKGAVTGAARNVVVEPIDIGPISNMVQELRGDFQSDLAVLQEELLANRKETRSDAEVLLEELRKVPEQLTKVHGGVAAEEEIQLTAAITTGVLDGITRLGLTERHSEVLEAITNVTVQPPDLAVVIDEITSLKGAVMGAVSNVVVEPIDIGPINKMMQDLQRDFQSDLVVIQQELLANRKETRSDAEVLLEELRKLPEHLTEVKNALRAVERKDNADVVRAIGGIDLDEQALATSVVDKLRRTTLKVDQEDVLRAISRVSTGDIDPENVARAVYERIIKVLSTRDDHIELVNLINKIKREPDFQPVLDALSASEELRGEVRAFGEELLANRKQTRSDAEVLLEELRKFPEQLAEVKNTLLAVERKDNADILRAVGGISLDEQAVASSVVDKLRRTTLKVDQEDVLQAISRVSNGDVDPEHIARAVHERIIKVVPTKDDHIELVNLVQKIKRAPEVDLSPVHDAIGRINLKVDHAPVLEAINGIGFLVDQVPVLEAIRQVSVPDAEAIATLVHDRIKQTQFTVLRPEVDFSTVHASLRALTDRIDDILRHLAELRSEAWRLREVHVVEKPPQVVREVRIENPRPKVVQPMLQSPVVQATAVVPATTAMVPATTAVVPATTTLVQTMASSPVTICCHCGNHYMDDSNFCRMCGKPRDLATPGMEMDLSLSPSTPW